MKGTKKKNTPRQSSSTNIDFVSLARPLKFGLIDTPEQARAIGRRMAADVSKKLKLKLTA